MGDEFENIDATIAAALKRLGADTPCPRCGNEKFNVMKGYSAHGIQSNPRGVVIGGGNMIATAVLACSRCGNIVQHDLSILTGPPADQPRH